MFKLKVVVRVAWGFGALWLRRAYRLREESFRRNMEYCRALQGFYTAVYALVYL